MNINATTISLFFTNKKNAITYKPATNDTPPSQTNIFNYNKSKKFLIFANEKTKNINLLNILT